MEHWPKAIEKVVVYVGMQYACTYIKYTNTRGTFKYEYSYINDVHTLYKYCISFAYGTIYEIHSHVYWDNGHAIDTVAYVHFWSCNPAEFTFLVMNSSHVLTSGNEFAPGHDI